MNKKERERTAEVHLPKDKVIPRGRGGRGKDHIAQHLEGRVFNGAPQAVDLSFDVARIQRTLVVVGGGGVTNGAPMPLTFLPSPMGLGKMDARESDRQAGGNEEDKALVVEIIHESVYARGHADVLGAQGRRMPIGNKRGVRYNRDAIHQGQERGEIGVGRRDGGTDGGCAKATR